MPFLKAERQLDLYSDDDDSAPPVADSSNDVFHSKFSSDDDNVNEATQQWTGSFPELKEMIKAKINEIDEQTGRLEQLREVRWRCDEQRCEHQQNVCCEENEIDRLRAEISELKRNGNGNRGTFAPLFEALGRCELRKADCQRRRDNAGHDCCRANVAINRMTEARPAAFKQLHHLANQHKQLVTKIKTDPQLRQIKEQLRNANERWDVISWPRPPRPSTIVASAIARKIDDENVGRRVYVIRNAERVQDVFPNWLNECFVGPNLDYVVGDANQPRAIPERRDHPADYFHDPPISEMGRELAILVGAALASRDRDRDFFFVSSPSLYCVQTAMAIKEGADLEGNKIGLEPGLFEDFNLEVNANGTTVPPNFLNAADFKSLGGEFNCISSDYRQATSLQAIRTLVAQQRTSEQRESRQVAAVAHVVMEAPANATVVVIAHPATLQAVHSYLGPRQPLPDTTTSKDLLGLRYPYLSVVGFHEMNGRWKRISDALPPLNYGSLTNAIDVMNNDRKQ